jgi:F0F1-type ATP synthase assembly protein I
MLSLAIAGLGSFLDSWLGTKIWFTAGIVLAMLFGISSLILVSKLSELDAKRAKEGGGRDGDGSRAE